MGSGKTSVGRALAELLSFHFVDTDELIERLANQSINQIFAEDGEARFRELETQVLAELSSYRQLVVATGGGIVLDKMNWSYLRHGLVVWLNVCPEALWNRLKTDDTRPLLKTDDPLATLQATLEQRLPLYQQADVDVEISEILDPKATCEIALQAIQVRLRSEVTELS